MATTEGFEQVLSKAVNDIIDHGYDNAEVMAEWMTKLREAARASLMPESDMDELLRQALVAEYVKMVDKGGLLRMHPGVSRFTIDRVRPQLKNELDRRIMASAQLIKLNREQEIEATLRRFAGWATSVPPGGTEAAKKTEVKQHIRKSLSGLSHRERTVFIDQGHKLNSTVSDIVATSGGAIAGVWRSHWKQANYDYREDHRDRDQEVYVVRDNWALQKGLMKRAGHRFTDDITKPGEEVNCRCYYRWIYSLQKLPPEMLTKKGEQAISSRKAA
jgi:hypothetical protein